MAAHTVGSGSCRETSWSQFEAKNCQRVAVRGPTPRCPSSKASTLLAQARRPRSTVELTRAGGRMEEEPGRLQTRAGGRMEEEPGRLQTTASPCRESLT